MAAREDVLTAVAKALVAQSYHSDADTERLWASMTEFEHYRWRRMAEAAIVGYFDWIGRRIEPHD